MYQLRPYQHQAVDATVAHFRASTHAAVIVLPTGAGKSLVIAELARIARGEVLVLAHVKELVEQNYQKYQSYGLTAGIFAAGLNRKENQHKVTFGSVQSIARNLDRFSRPISLVIIDECHRVTLDDGSQYQSILSHLKKSNPALRVLGLTATPFRLGMGWIYNYHYHGIARSHEAKPFRRCIYELPLRHMLSHGYLTPPRLDAAPLIQYQFPDLHPQDGLFSTAELDRCLSSQKRLTPLIMKHLLMKTHECQGVMIFASTIRHAKELLDYLPADQAALILGETSDDERDRLINAFKARQLKYLVNVSVLTTGFDAPHVDLIALLRPTESVSLYHQIIGRGLRLAPGKQECLILDYAGNNYDLHQPEIGQWRPSSDCVPVQILCPACGFANTFWGKQNEVGVILEHFGRKCQGLLSDDDGDELCCDYRFRFKLCPDCGAENDIAARQCHQCQSPLVDADRKLKQALANSEHLVLRCVGQSLNVQDKQLIVTYHDEDGAELEEQFDFTTVPERHRFYQTFLRQHWQVPGMEPSCQSAQDAFSLKAMYRSPDFVIARKVKKHLVICDKLFDYEGRFRRAYELG